MKVGLSRTAGTGAPRLLGLGLGACVLVAVTGSGCDVALRVGEPRAAPDAALLAPPAEAGPEPAAPMWRLRAPLVPCSVHSMAEARADRVYLGCSGGVLYRFDGTHAKPEVVTDDDRIFDLLWVAPSGEVWAAAQKGFGSKRGTSSELHRFDGKAWSKVSTGPLGNDRLVAITGTSAVDVWFATTSEIFHFDGTTFTSRYVSPGDELRGCAFAAPDRGFCGGTGGLAVMFDGTAWSPLVGAPWAQDAEVLDVETTREFGRPAAAMFFYAEPASLPNGDHLCRAAKWDGAFAPYAAAQPCSPSFDVARKRAARVTVGGPTFWLLSVEENFGGALVFDAQADEWRTLCGPILAFAEGKARTHVGGRDGLLGTIVGTGSTQLAVDAIDGSGEDLSDLSVAADGTPWARAESVVACSSVTERVVRVEAGAWTLVPAPQWALSGQSMAALAYDHVLTIAEPDEALGSFDDGDWRILAPLDRPWSLWAKRADDVWIGGTKDNFGRFDGVRFIELAGAGRGRQIEQISATDDGDVWMVAVGYTKEDTDTHLYRYAEGKLTEWSLGLPRASVQVSALDRTNAFRSGSPAQRWDGAKWTPLGFEASGVWARSPNEVYFTRGGDIFRFDGTALERAYHGFIHIMRIHGTTDRAFAIGAGGLTIEFSAVADPTR